MTPRGRIGRSRCAQAWREQGTTISVGYFFTGMQVEMISILNAAQLDMQEGGCRRMCICPDSGAASQSITVASKYHNILNKLVKN